MRESDAEIGDVRRVDSNLFVTISGPPGCGATTLADGLSRALDCGWISVDDDRNILVNEATDINPPKHIESLSGESLREPDTDAEIPHSVYLEAHRRLHGFE
jgi:stage III sporulation protein SpoIIIAA